MRRSEAPRPKRKQNKEDNTWCDEWLNAIKRGKWDIWWYSHIQCIKSDEIRTKMKDKIDISDSYKNLIERMLCFNPTKRISIEEVLKHPWIIGNGCSGKGGDVITKEEFLKLYN